MDWRDVAVCITAHNIDAFFSDDPTEAKLICFSCPARPDCLRYACQLAANDDLYGVWGGMTEEERRDLILRNSIAEGTIQIVYEEL